MNDSACTIRNANPDEFQFIGNLMVDVYSALEGFPKPHEHPKYFEMLANVGELTTKPGTEILVAVLDETVVGAVVYFSDMQYYGSKGTATQEKNAAGFRLLAVDDKARGKGIGKLLTLTCLEKAKLQKQQQMIIHTTNAMKPAWNMYEAIGFQRSADLDFTHDGLDVFGLRYKF
ncbi:GNAT family N-acetyltransferase [Flavobacterium sp.]|uniref:GNAT family N-acetyltransferase n=1 Tax=Flavobacterium sp. TaxID=239 RepID=UPI0028BECE25|nr:GNAT family N-acetyltransferase [Flavobacterium sp.]